MKKLILTILLTGLFSASSQAGSEPSVGGDLVTCPGQETVTLAFFHTMRPILGPEKLPMPNFANWTDTDTVNFFRGCLKDTLLLQEFDKALAAVGPLDQWLIAEFIDKDFKSDPYATPSQCIRIKATRRISNVTYIDPAYTSALSRFQLGLLRVHEALYQVYKEKHLTSYGADDVRDLMRKLLILDTPKSQIDYSLKLFKDPYGDSRKPIYIYQDIFYSWFTDGSYPFDTVRYQSQDSSSCQADREGCDLIFGPGTEGQNIFTRFDDGAKSDYMKFSCSVDGLNCKMVEGESRFIFKVGCQLNLNTVARTLTFTCPNTGKTWVYKRY